MVDKRIDNYDQRITDDLQAFLQGFLGAVIGNFTCFIPMIFSALQAFGGILAVIELGGSTMGYTLVAAVVLMIALGVGVLLTINPVCSLQVPATCCTLPAACCHCTLLAAHCLLLAAHCLLHVACCTLPAAIAR